MVRFYVGQVGYDHEESFSNEKEAELAALNKSFVVSGTAYAVWDEYPETLSVAVDGVLSKKHDDQVIGTQTDTQI